MIKNTVNFKKSNWKLRKWLTVKAPAIYYNCIELAKILFTDPKTLKDRIIKVSGFELNVDQNLEHLFLFKIITNDGEFAYSDFAGVESNMLLKFIKKKKKNFTIRFVKNIDNLNLRFTFEIHHKDKLSTTTVKVLRAKLIEYYLKTFEQFTLKKLITFIADKEYMLSITLPANSELKLVKVKVI